MNAAVIFTFGVVFILGIKIISFVEFYSEFDRMQSVNINQSHSNILQYRFHIFSNKNSCKVNSLSKKSAFFA